MSVFQVHSIVVLPSTVLAVFKTFIGVDWLWKHQSTATSWICMTLLNNMHDFTKSSNIGIKVSIIVSHYKISQYITKSMYCHSPTWEAKYFTRWHFRFEKYCSTHWGTSVTDLLRRDLLTQPLCAAHQKQQLPGPIIIYSPNFRGNSVYSHPKHQQQQANRLTRLSSLDDSNTCFLAFT